MISPVARILSWSRRHRPLLALSVGCLAALSAYGATRLSFDTDVLSLLPRTGQVIPAFRTYVDGFGSLDELYVVFSAPDGHAIPDYAEQIDEWIERLRAAPEFTRVDAGLLDFTRDLAWLADRELLLLPDAALDEALGRFRGPAMRTALASRRELLTLPSPSIEAVVREDPLGLLDLWRARVTGFGPSTSGQYVTADSQSRLVIAHPARPPYDTAFAHTLFAALDRIRAGVAASRPAAPDEEAPPPLHVEFAGGHRIAIETEAIVRRESILNTVVSLALILPLLWIVFRSLWLVAVGPIPAALSLLVVLGGLGLAGTTLSAAATASAAMLFGLGVDGVVLLYVSHALVLRNTPAAAADARHLAGPAGSMMLGMLTTAATFLGLTAVDFPSLEQLGLLIGCSMALCGVLTLVLVPALLPQRMPSQRVAALGMPALARWIRARRRAILVIAALLTLVLGGAALRLRLDPTLDRLRSVTPAAVMLERVARRFALPDDVYVILQRGPDLDALLVDNERLTEGIAAALPGMGLQMATALLPSAAAQERRAAKIRSAGLPAGQVEIQLQAAAQAEGFQADALRAFRERLPRLLEPDARVTYDSYRQHGLTAIVERFVRRTGDDWLVVSYAFPAARDGAARLARVVADQGSGAVLTGLPLVNEELGRRFLPQFAKGLMVGTVIVILLVAAAFRDWRLSLLSLGPAAIGLVWSAGVLALARVELDLFAVFAVVTFVGIGVDYGVHLVHRYRACGDARQAIEELAPVILVAAAITLLGYGTLIVSSYPPLRSIGLVSLVTVVTLAAASVFVLPALLPARDRTARAVRHTGPGSR